MQKKCTMFSSPAPEAKSRTVLSPPACVRSTTDYFARIYPAGRFCHQKSIMRPLQTNFIAAHGLYSSWHDEYESVPREVLSDGLYLKHLQCMRNDEDWSTDAPLCLRAPGPIDYSKDAVFVCPGDS